MAANKDNVRIRVKLKGYDVDVLDRSAKDIAEAAVSTGAKVLGPIPLPVKRRVYAIKRSPFVYKSSFEHFEMKVHKRLIDILDPTPTTIETLRNLQVPPGVGLTVK